VKLEPLPSPAADLNRAILGTWRLVSRIDLDGEGKRHIDPFLGADPIGVLSFTPNHFAAQFMNRKRDAAPPAGSSASGANNTSAVGGYDAYFGAYVFDPSAGTIATTLEGALSPANVGVTFTREIRVVGDRLLIRLATTAADGTAVTRTLTWERAT
jgi:lipocalin-like protein